MEPLPQSASEGYFGSDLLSDRFPGSRPLRVQPSGLKPKKIASIAADCRKKWGYNRGKTLTQIVSDIGGKINYTSDWDDPYQLESKGSIAILPSGQFIIWLSPSISELENNFILVHELGHYELQFNRSEIVYDRPMVAARYNSGPADTEANTFALNFLVPKRVLKEFLKIKRSNSELEAKFKVSRRLITMQM